MKSMSMLIAIAATAHAACSVAVTGSRGGPAQPRDASVGVAPTSDVSVGVAPPWAHPDTLWYSQLAGLRGRTPDAAKLELQRFGHVGKVAVRALSSQQYDPACGAAVCQIMNDRGLDVAVDGAGRSPDKPAMAIDDGVVLLINPTLTIALPPP